MFFKLKKRIIQLEQCEDECTSIYYNMLTKANQIRKNTNLFTLFIKIV